MKLFNCEIIRKVSAVHDRVAFTFDDGPHPENTPAIMGLLEKKQGRGTFFLTGRNILRNRELVKEMATRGHCIGNHTFNHGRALFQKKAILRDEIVRTKEMIEDITGVENRFLRPPYGIITPYLCSTCSDFNMKIVLWSVNSFDFRRLPVKDIVKRAGNRLDGGTILLFHECHFRDSWRDYTNSIIALESILQIAQEAKLKPFTIEELI